MVVGMACTGADELIRLVESACNDILLTPNWSLNMQIVDDINQERDQTVLSEVVRAVRKKMGSRSTRSISLALTLAEALVKNCGTAVHLEVATDKFMDAVSKVARTHSFKSSRDSQEVADQALCLIQAWGEAFLPLRVSSPNPLG
ncbi:unnamed protein product [Discosporangium mesarthrocarpum]